MLATSRDVFELCRPRYKAATQEEFLLLVLKVTLAFTFEFIEQGVSGATIDFTRGVGSDLYFGLDQILDTIATYCQRINDSAH